MGGTPIYKLMDDLPQQNITVMALQGLDFVAPGEWQNIVGFDAMIQNVAGTEDPEKIQQIGKRAIDLYNDDSQGYQTAIWLYQTVDSTDYALGAAALANKVGNSINLLGFLNNITPRADKVQSIDLSVKLVAELLAFTKINGLPGDSIGDFVKSLSKYREEALMRMAALVCFDGVLPFGPDVAQLVVQKLHSLSAAEIEENKTFQRIRSVIPGDGLEEQFGFVTRSVDAVQDWMGGFVSERNLTGDKIASNLSGFLSGSDQKLDYVSAFLDLTTNYFEHTGTQTVARQLIRRARAEI